MPRTAIAGEAEVVAEAPDLPRGDVTPERAGYLRRAVAEARRNERPIGWPASGGNERRVTASNTQQGAVDARRRNEASARHGTNDIDLEPRLVEQRELRLDRRAGELLGGLSLHHEHAIVGRACRVQQLPDDRGRDPVRHVRDDAVRARWQRKRQEVCQLARDIRRVREPFAQRRVEPPVPFDGDDAKPGLSQRCGEHAVSCARLDDGVSRREREPAHERARDMRIAQEVLG